MEDSTATEETDIFTRGDTESTIPSYRYRDSDLRIIWQTSVPKDDEAALAYFHVVTRFGADYAPVYCERLERNEEGEKPVMLQWIFDPETCQTSRFKL